MHTSAGALPNQAALARHRNESRSTLGRRGRSWPVQFRLLLIVNLTLAGLLATILWADYRREMAEAVEDRFAGLEDEAIAVHQAVAHLLHRHDVADVQHYVDTVCSAMREGHPSGHHIAVEFNGTLVQAHAAEPAAILPSLKAGARSPDHLSTYDGKGLVVSRREGGGVAVYASEYTTTIRRAARAEIFRELATLTGLAAVAAVIVNVALVRMLTRPLESLAHTVARIAAGGFGVRVSRFGNRQLDRLADAVNMMSSALAEGETRRRSQMERAREIQDHLLPREVDLPGLRAAVLFRPAEGVAGDYYDVLPLPDGAWLVCVADVAGHGVPAAMGAAILKTLLLCATEHLATPGEILRHVNRRFVHTSLPSYFASMFLARWEPDELRLEYASAGHEPGLLCQDDGVRRLSATGLLIGVSADLTWETECLRVTPGQRLLLMTDGVVETSDPRGELFGRQRPADMLAASKIPPARFLGDLEKALADHRESAGAMDDVTCLMIEFRAVARSHHTAIRIPPITGCHVG